MHHLLDLADKKAPMLIETESGTTSTDPASWREQARTVVQKLTFAQSTHEIPAFLWVLLPAEMALGNSRNGIAGKTSGIGLSRPGPTYAGHGSAERG